MYKFTLIIPTHNRHKYLLRSIEYFKDLDAQVIYVDSSSIPFTGKIAQNMHYLHLPNKKFAEKILFALAETSNEIVALCADDDFILIESMYEGYELLNLDGDVSTIVGKYVSFQEEFDGKFSKNLTTLPDIIGTSNERAELFFKNYYQILWAMYRKQVLITAFKIVQQAEISNDNFIELIIGSVSCFCGRIKYLNAIWGVREINTVDHWGEKHVNISVLDNKYREQEFKRIRAVLDQCTSNGYSNLVLKSYLKFARKKSASPKSFIKKLIPYHLHFLLSKLALRMRNNNNDHYIDEELLPLSTITKVLKNYCKNTHTIKS